MTRFAIDPLTLLQLAEGSHQVGAATQLVAPNSIRPQALDLLLRRVTRGELAEEAALGLHEGMTVVKVRQLGDRVSRRTAWQLARELGWNSIPKAEYLAVAKLQADALVTADPELAEKAAGIVPLGRFADLLVG